MFFYIVATFFEKPEFKRSKEIEDLPPFTREDCEYYYENKLYNKK